MCGYMKGKREEEKKTDVVMRRLRGDLRAACQYLKGPTGRMERDFSQGCVVIGQGGTAVN